MARSRRVVHGRWRVEQSVSRENLRCQARPNIVSSPGRAPLVGANPIYIAALLVVVGEAWLALSLPLLLCAGAIAIFFHLFMIGSEERTPCRRFGDA